MRPSTRKALAVAAVLAVASAELGTVARPGADERDSAGAARPWSLLESGSTAAAGRIARSEELLTTVGAGVAAASKADGDELSPPWAVQLRRESLVRRARGGVAAGAADLEV